MNKVIHGEGERFKVHFIWYQTDPQLIRYWLTDNDKVIRTNDTPDILVFTCDQLNEFNRLLERMDSKLDMCLEVLEDFPTSLEDLLPEEFFDE